ncbi:MAG: hypothetical protein KC910_01435 [Candidatus Eremiobacteraeota bacterium]|nr:hypothetical protein [Candidatus Eremiobacteraeota bacterium]
MTRRRGIGIIAALLLISLLFLLGLGVASQGARRYQQAAWMEKQVAARALAEAGLEDARVKLLKDWAFPPPTSMLSDSFGYTEQVQDLDGNLVGTYTVELDYELMPDPHRLLKIRSTGELGPPGERRVRRVLEAEVDMSATLRTNAATPNPNYIHFLSIFDLGANS